MKLSLTRTQLGSLFARFQPPFCLVPKLFFIKHLCAIPLLLVMAPSHGGFF